MPNRDAVTGEFVTDEYAAQHPETTVTESIEFDVPDDVSELTENRHEEAPYRTLLEIWRAVLEPAIVGEMRQDPISPQWATKMVTTYPGVGFADVEPIHHGVFDLAAELGQILQDEIDSDEECLKKADAQEDREENSGHYKYLLAAWQVHLVQAELAWRPSHRDAAVQLAILSEVQQMFLGEMGLVAHLDSIGFQFDDADKAELQEHLVNARNMVLAARGDDE
jgi:hypothetical protein